MCPLFMQKKLNVFPQRTDWWLPRESEGRMDWEFSLSRRKLLQTGWANNMVLLCPTWNYSQHPMITVMEKNIKKRRYIYIHVCMYN